MPTRNFKERSGLSQMVEKRVLGAGKDKLL
jgi:hypothetical protein